jgi:hypothetical protein
MSIEKNKKNGKKRQRPLLIFFLMISVFGIILLLRGYFLDNALVSDKLSNIILDEIDVLPVAGVAGVASNNVVPTYGKDIKDESKPVDTDGILLKVDNSSSTFVGSLTVKKKEEDASEMSIMGPSVETTYSPIVVLPTGLNDLKVFETGEVMYVTKGSIEEYSKVIWKEKEIVTLLDAGSGESEYISAYFEANTKDIYAVKKYREGRLVLELLRLSNDIYTLYETNDLDQMEVIRVESSKNKIYLKVRSDGDMGCIQLDLVSKTYVGIACDEATIPFHSFYLSSTSQAKRFTGSGDVISMGRSDSGKNILSAPGDKIFAALSYKDSLVSFLEYGVFDETVVLEKARVYDATSKSDVLETSDLPPMDYPLDTAVDRNGNIYLLVSLGGQEKIFVRLKEEPSWYDIKTSTCSGACNYTFLK